VVVITSRQVKNLRSRYGAAGAKDDRFDAFVLADVLRTDRARLRPLVPDSPATLALRAAVRARRDLVAHRVAACNQLRAHLEVSFPAGTRLFAELDSRISLAFLTRFGSQDAAGALSEGDIAAWLKTLPRRGKTAGPEQLLARLRAAPAGATGAGGAARAAVTSALVITLVTVTAQIGALEAEIAAQLEAHPHAVRITARAWLYVIWRCWQESTAYDPDKHSALQRTLEQQQHPPGDDDAGTGSGR
jgi:transposase